MGPVLLILSLVVVHRLTASRAQQFHGLYSGELSEYEVVIPVKLTSGGQETSQLRHKRSIEDSHQVTYRLKRSRDKEDMVLELWPNEDFFSAGMRVYRRAKRSSPPRHIDCHYRGHIRSHNHSSVSLSACHSGLVGLIRSKDGELWLEPVKGGGGTPAHLLYKRVHLRHNKKHRKKNKRDFNCGTREPRRMLMELSPEKKKPVWVKKLPVRQTRVKRSVSRPRHVEALVVADTTMVSFHSDTDLETYLLTIMNMVSSTYHDPSIGNYINIVVVRMILLEDDINEGLNITVNADQALKNFCKWQLEQNPTDDDHPHHHDVAILITRKDICSRKNTPCSTLGVAHIGGMCQPEKSCNLNEDNGITLAHTITHELGHNFGMYHDTPQVGCEGREGSVLHVMTPNFEADTTHIAWSGCSRRDITLFLDQGMGDCLEDVPTPEEPYSYPDLPPGAIYNADYQCKLQFGSTTATVCSPLEEICSRLWCKVDGVCSSMLYPAATGTHCGKHKWCINQKCVTIGDKRESVNGGWGSWGSWGGCSRSCGGGVSLRSRHCNSPVPSFGGKFCVGQRTRYRVCNTQDCPEGSPSFRSEQCSQYNQQDMDFRNLTFTPYFEKDEPCHLFCKESDRTLIEPFGDSALDGTPCNLGTNDMCIGGICKKVGCDWVVDSEAIEDKCGVCRGNGSRCVTHSGDFNKKITPGLVEIVVVPAKARNIIFEERGHYKTFLSLASQTKNKFYINGKGELSIPGEFQVSGVIGLYERRKEKERLHIPGPLRQPIVLFVSGKNKNQSASVHYEYTVMKETKENKHYEWEYEWSVCSRTCGTGVETSSAHCIETITQRRVNSSLCPSPPNNSTRSCNTFPCPTRWWVGPWQACSATCGKGSRRRTVLCVADRSQTLALPDSECKGQTRPQGSGPCPLIKPCSQLQYSRLGKSGQNNFSVVKPISNHDERSPLVTAKKSKWLVHPWEACSSSCGPGYQRRVVLCSQFSRSCDSSLRPHDIRPCFITSCHS